MPAPVAIPVRTNAMLAACVLAAHAGVLVALPLMSAPAAAVWIGAIVLGLASHLLWALIHEAIHGVLLPDRAANVRLGRVLAIAFGAPFRVLRFAHLRHHRHNRSEFGREEVYDPATTSRAAALVGHYLRIACALYIGEIALNLAAWMPRAWLRGALPRACAELRDDARLRSAIEHELTGPAALAEWRVDAACALLLWTLAFWLGAAHWPALLALLGLRGFIVSQMDHAPHHGTPLGDRRSGLNLRAPRWLQAALLHFNLHRAHHEAPQLPWTALPARARFGTGDIALWRAVLRQWRGPITLPQALALRADAATAGIVTAD